MKAPKNMNELAKVLAEKEKGKKEVSIAQIKEVLKALGGVLKKHPVETIQLLLRYSAKQ